MTAASGASASEKTGTIAEADNGPFQPKVGTQRSSTPSRTIRIEVMT